MGAVAQPNQPDPPTQSIRPIPPNPPKSAYDKARNWTPTRSVIAVAILLAVAVYVVRIVAYGMDEKHRLTGADAAIVVVGILIGAILMQPQLLENIKHFKLGSIEFELQHLQRKQEKQQADLDGVRLALTLLVQESERGRLRKLKSGDTKDTIGSHELRTDLRRLRTLRLVQSVGERKIAELKDGQKLDLKNIVELTEDGKNYLDQLGDPEQDTSIGK
jgi:hypothetical protein